jgi:hypothetical protein
MGKSITYQEKGLNISKESTLLQLFNKIKEKKKNP